jgi:uncharacterized protein YlxW (UPF0749 family)
MPEYVVDFSEFSKVLDELINKTYTNYKSVEPAESDIVGKYRKLYEASVKVETLKQRRTMLEKQVAAYNESIASIDSQIEELNKLFTN